MRKTYLPWRWWIPFINAAQLTRTTVKIKVTGGTTFTLLAHTRRENIPSGGSHDANNASRQEREFSNLEDIAYDK